MTVTVPATPAPPHKLAGGARVPAMTWIIVAGTFAAAGGYWLWVRHMPPDTSGDASYAPEDAYQEGTGGGGGGSADTRRGPMQAIDSPPLPPTPTPPPEPTPEPEPWVSPYPPDYDGMGFYIGPSRDPNYDGMGFYIGPHTGGGPPGSPSPVLQLAPLPLHLPSNFHTVQHSGSIHLPHHH